MYEPPRAAAGALWERPNSINITSISPEALGLYGRTTLSSGIASALWPIANLALLFPFQIGQPYTVATLGLATGSPVASSNVDVGIYSAPDDGSSSLTRIISTGSQPEGTANTWQSIAVTPTVLQPGRYYMALALDNNIAAVSQKTAAAIMTLASSGMAQALSAFPLPNPLTISVMAQAMFPMFGASQKAAF